MATVDKNGVDYSGLRELEKQLEKLVKTSVDVGFFSDAVYEEPDHRAGIPVADIAAANNYGNGVPKRGFMDASWTQVEKTFGKLVLKQAIEQALQGKPPQEYVQPVGVGVRDLIKQMIIDWDNPPNAALTIKLKGKDDPLRDTDKMLNSVDYRINKEGVK